MLKCGIIGFGKMGKIRAQAIERSGRGKVVAVYDAYDADFGDYPVSKSSEGIIAHDEIEAVFICTPNYQNKPLTIEAMQTGKHVFCEKPPAFNADEVKEIQAVEASSNVKLMYGFNHRHHASIKNMKLFIDSGKYGRILWMRGRYGKSVDDDFFENWRAKKELSGGGILLDQGIHMLDLFLFLGGEFDEVQAMVSNIYWKLEDIEDNVFAILRNNQTGLVASLHSTMSQWRHIFSLEVFLERGYMTLNGLKTSSNTYGDEILSIAKNRSKAPAATWDDEERVHYKTDISWDQEVNVFLESVLLDQPIKIGNSNDALKVMMLVDRIYATKRHQSEVLHDSLVL